MAINNYRTFYEQNLIPKWKGSHYVCTSFHDKIASDPCKNSFSDRSKGSVAVVLSKIKARLHSATTVRNSGAKTIHADRLSRNSVLSERMVRPAKSPQTHQNPTLHNTAKGSAAPFKKNAWHCLQAAIFQFAANKGLLNEPIGASIDSTGLESHYVSQHYLHRKGRTKRYRRWHKLIFVCDNDSHLIPEAKVNYGPSFDGQFLPDVIREAVEIVSINTLLADSGFDDETNHTLCQRELHIPVTVIALNLRGSQRGVITGNYRKQMEKCFPKSVYSQRSQVENVISCMKRRLGSFLRACTESTRRVECLMRVLTFNLMILLCTFLKSDYYVKKVA
jgi:hypothetical protein